MTAQRVPSPTLVLIGYSDPSSSSPVPFYPIHSFSIFLFLSFPSIPKTRSSGASAVRRPTGVLFSRPCRWLHEPPLRNIWHVSGYIRLMPLPVLFSIAIPGPASFGQFFFSVVFFPRPMIRRKRRRRPNAFERNPEFILSPLTSRPVIHTFRLLLDGSRRPQMPFLNLRLSSSEGKHSDEMRFLVVSSWGPFFHSKWLFPIGNISNGMVKTNRVLNHFLMAFCSNPMFWKDVWTSMTSLWNLPAVLDQNLVHLLFIGTGGALVQL